MQGVRFACANASAIHEYEVYLIDRLRSVLAAMPEITVYGDGQAPHMGVLSFNVRDRECAEIADLLDQKGFCLRGGLHCAPCMHHWLGTQGTVRASVGPYSTEQEIDGLIAAVQDIVRSK